MRIFLEIGLRCSPMRQNRQRALRSEIRDLFLTQDVWLTS